MKKKYAAIESVNLDNRLYVLKTALLIEKLTTYFLASLLEASDNINGKSFSGSSALSFNQKLNLLIDINILDKGERMKFQKFMEIRNQFMHDLDASTFTECINRIDGASAYLFKRYDLKNIEVKEAAYETGVKLLCADVYESALALGKSAMDKAKERYSLKFNAEAMQAFKESIEESIPQIEDWARRVKEGTEPNVPEVIGNVIAYGIYDRANKKMECKLPFNS